VRELSQYMEDCPDVGASDSEGRLTGIPRCYTLASTPEHGSETDQLMVRNFLQTLAEVALAVASRSLQSEEEEK